MKYFIAALLCAFTATAQSLDVNTTDKNTGLRTILTKNTERTQATQDDSVVKNGTVFFSAGYQEVQAAGSKHEFYYFELNLVHNDARVGCLTQEKGKVVLVLADGSEIECMQISPTDCDTVGFVASFVLGNKVSTAEQIKANFERLQHTAVKKMIVYTTEKVISFNVKNTAQPVISKHFGIVAGALAK